MDRWITVHGHFYQPPRENPWLESVELQESAYPYHDWNERITAECYAPNGASRILDDQGRIERIVNNYARMSFNVGPTLMAWMERHDATAYEAIIEADADSAKRFSGHGSAMAQPYNHTILPLSNERDLATQVRWGLADFARRFRRDPEGMWLPETAVDLATLESLAEHGIAFTVLEPGQAARVRRQGSAEWNEVTAAELDTTVPYRLTLPSGRTIAIFFYDGATSRAVAFEGLLGSGARFADHLVGRFADRAGPQLVHIATDGESYGHHHRHGEMALAYALQRIEQLETVGLTNYGEHLERQPPVDEVEIRERTSWSCAHGVERWRSDCGCTTAPRLGWGQAWRAPLRAALDWLRDELVPRYEDRARQLLRDPWAARDAYIEVVLDRRSEVVDSYLDAHAVHPLDDGERVAALELLELQRHAMLMYTSCGWFFEDLGRIETIQVLAYAGRVIQLAERHWPDAGVQDGFLDRLASARSNDPELGDGRAIYDRSVRPSVADLPRVAANYVVGSLFERHGRRARVHCYRVNRRDQKTFDAGRARLAVASVDVRSEVTGEAASLDVGMLHLGDHNVTGGVRPAVDQAAFDALAADLADPLARSDLPDAIARLDAAFGQPRVSLRTLFRDELRAVLGDLLDSSVAEAETAYRELYRSRAPLMRFLVDLGVQAPKAMRAAAELVVNRELRDAFTDEALDRDRVMTLLAEAALWRLDLDTAGLAHALDQTIRSVTEWIVGQLAEDPSMFDRFGDPEAEFFDRVETLVATARGLPFEVSLWQPQNVFFDVLQSAYPMLRERADAGDDVARQWVDHLRTLGENLGVKVA